MKKYSLSLAAVLLTLAVSAPARADDSDTQIEKYRNDLTSMSGLALEKEITVQHLNTALVCDAGALAVIGIRAAELVPGSPLTAYEIIQLIKTRDISQSVLSLRALKALITKKDSPCAMNIRRTTAAVEEKSSRLKRFVTGLLDKASNAVKKLVKEGALLAQTGEDTARAAGKAAGEALVKASEKN